jgi:hypothetical protein
MALMEICEVTNRLNAVTLQEINTNLTIAIGISGVGMKYI